MPNLAAGLLLSIAECLVYKTEPARLQTYEVARYQLCVDHLKCAASVGKRRKSTRFVFEGVWRGHTV